MKNLYRIITALLWVGSFYYSKALETQTKPYAIFNNIPYFVGRGPITVVSPQMKSKKQGSTGWHLLFQKSSKLVREVLVVCKTSQVSRVVFHCLVGSMNQPIFEKHIFASQKYSFESSPNFLGGLDPIKKILWVATTKRIHLEMIYTTRSTHCPPVILVVWNASLWTRLNGESRQWHLQAPQGLEKSDEKNNTPAKAVGEKMGKKSSRGPLLRSHFFCFGNMSKFA